jgi:uncharacterized protein YgiM (DUF1202 family)
MRRPVYTPLRLYCLVAAGILLACASSERASAELSPYEARVVATGAPILSGPGENYYPTDTLAQGDVVEVYREKSGGWLAIRPPLNSFSWVPGSNLKKQEDGLAEVVKDNVASRIGSRLNDKRNAAQVRLKKGELVEVIDEEKFGDETWYKIAPPAGEFRWIQAALVERAELVKTASAETPVTESSAPPLISNTQASSATPAQPQATAPATTLPAATTPVAPQSAAAAPVAPPPSGPVADDLSRSLTEIELRLSRMVSAPVNLWNTERLERDTAQLLARAQSTADRDAVQVTMNKISRFAQIAHRAYPSGATTAQPAPAGQTPVMPQQTGVAATAPSGPYDATGILRPVVSRRPGAPQFALVDERGQVLSFITPTPDVNLQPYLGHRVGVVGNKGYIAEFNRSHVTAARVMPLNDKMVR